MQYYWESDRNKTQGFCVIVLLPNFCYEIPSLTQDCGSRRRSKELNNVKVNLRDYLNNKLSKLIQIETLEY